LKLYEKAKFAFKKYCTIIAELSQEIMRVKAKKLSRKYEGYWE
jgi:hypothetical protein